MRVRGRLGCMLQAHYRRAGKGATENGLELRGARDDRRRLNSQHVRQTRRKHDLVADPLFAVNEQGATGQRFAVPRRE